MSLVTLWALFGDDIRLLVGDLRSDTPFYILTLVCFSIFSVEILLSCYAKSDYLNSFYFYLDVISTVTLLLDVGWISDSIFSAGSSGAAAAKVGTKATRLIRILRLIRLIRIVKLYKAAQMHREKKIQERRKELLRQKAAIEKMRMERTLRIQQMQLAMDEDASPSGTMRNSPAEYEQARKASGGCTTPPGEMAGSSGSRRGSIDKLSIINSIGSPLKGRTGLLMALEEVKDSDGGEADAEVVQESNVNKTLSSNINKIVIVLILCIMLSVPLFDSSTYLSDSYSVQAASFSILNK